jgi:hypothetical protein
MFELTQYDNKGAQSIYDNRNFVKIMVRDHESGKKKTEVRLLFQNENMFLFSETIKIKAYVIAKNRVTISIGSIDVKWKDCVDMAKDAKSKTVLFKENLKENADESDSDSSGTLTGELKWIRFGSLNSIFEENGAKKDDPLPQKTTAADSFIVEELDESESMDGYV